MTHSEWTLTLKSCFLLYVSVLTKTAMSVNKDSIKFLQTRESYWQAGVIS